MQLNITTDYAVRCIMYLAHTKRTTSAAEIGEYMCVSKNFVVGIMKKLREAELVEAVRGTAGGFYLARPAGEITLYDVVSTMENTMAVSRCLEDGVCNRNAIVSCNVRKFYDILQNSMDEMLKNITMEQLACNLEDSF